MNIPTYEQETTISYSRQSMGVDIWTSDRTVMTKLNKLVESSDHYTVQDREIDRDGDTVAMVYHIDDKSLLSFRGKKVQMSEEQRRANAERLNLLRNAQSGAENENAE